MAQDIECQLVDGVKKGKYALQLDESTDILNSAQLLVFIRYSVTENIMLFCSALEWTCTGEDIFTKLKEEGTIFRKLYWCVSGQGWSGAGGKGRTESESLTRGAARKFHTLYYSQRIFASKTLEPELKHILDIAIKMVNYIKTRPLNTCSCGEMC